MITLARLRSLLERALTHAENPAIVRLTDRTVEGVARAYLSRTLSVVPAPSFGASTFHAASARAATWHATRHLDLTDPGTAHALLVALALALGLEPGVGGVGVSWTRDGELAWVLSAGWASYTFTAIKVHAVFASWLDAPTVAAEPDPIKALGLAVLHVLEHP